MNARIRDNASNSVWFLILGVASITLFIKTDFYDPFNTSKLILLIVVSGWLSGHLVYSYIKFPITLKSHEFVILFVVSIFILFLGISTLYSDAIKVSFFGETQRRNGFLSYLALSIIFLFSSRSINKTNVLRIYKIGILTGFALSSYGLMQLNGKDFIAWDNPYNSMISTLGNPNFASAMLAVLLSLALFGVTQKKLSIMFKSISIFFIPAALIAIIGSDSRQGLLAIFFSLIFYFSVYTYIKSKKIGRITILFSFLLSILAVLGMLQRGPLSSLLYKDSVSVRGYYWRAGIKMFADHPLTGIGVDRYGAYFKAYRESGYSLKYGYDITSSNAHNTFIQMFATAGLFVGLAYLALVILVFSVGIKSLRLGNSEDKKILLGLLSAWIGFQSQSLISVDNIGISVWGWLLGGSILGYCLSLEKVNNNSNSKLISRSNANDINLLQPLISVIFLIPLIVISIYLYNSEKDLNYLKTFTNPSAPQNKKFVLDRSNSIFDNPFADPYYKYRAALYVLDMGDSEKAYKVVRELHQQDRNNCDYLRALAYFEESRKNLSAAISIREELSKQDPWNADNYYNLMLIYKNLGDFSNANIIKSKILDIAPGTDIAKKTIETFS